MNHIDSGSPQRKQMLLTPEPFIFPAPPQFLRQGILLNLELLYPTELVGQCAQGSTCPLLNAGVTDTPLSALCSFTYLITLATMVLIFSSKILLAYLRYHLPCKQTKPNQKHPANKQPSSPHRHKDPHETDSSKPSSAAPEPNPSREHVHKGGPAQLVECMPSMCEVLCLIPSTT